MSHARPLDAIRPPKYVASKTAWLLTFIDLTSILVGFFVLLFSTQTLDHTTWSNMTEGMRQTFVGRSLVGKTPVQPPSGVNNALVVATGETSGLGYLDSLLHQRMAGDPVWSRLVAKGKTETWVKEMYYDIPQEVRDPQNPAAIAAWARLGAGVRGWKNPLQIRTEVPNDAAPKAVAAATQQALALAALLRNAGVDKLAVDVRRAPTAGLYWVVGVE